MLLKLEEEIMARAKVEAEENPLSKHSTVSFLGATTVGKSTLINLLLKRLTGDNSVTGPRVRAVKQTGPTTSGASFYRLQQPESTLILMDCEGQGGNCPQEEQRATGDTKDPKWTAARRDVTKQDLRRLAYVSSHVMVYVCENGLANHDAFFATIEEFAMDVTERIANAEKPALVIIANKWSGDEGMAQKDVDDFLRPDWTTKKFFSEHDPHETLKTHFHDVVVMALPHRSVMLTLDDESTCSLAPLFEAQVSKVLDTIMELIEAKNGDRRSRGNLLCENAWLCLFQTLMTDFYVAASESESRSIELRPVDMSGTLLKVLMDDHEVLAGATALFLAVRARQQRALQDAPRMGDPSLFFQTTSVVDGMLSSDDCMNYEPLVRTRQCKDAPALAFVQALQATLPMIALASLRQPLDFLDGANMFETEALLLARQEELWTSKVEPALLRFLSQAEALQPCSACYDDPRGSYSVIFCDQPRQNHPVGTHSSESRFILEYDQSVLAKAMGGFRKRIFRMSKEQRNEARTKIRPATWPTASAGGRWLRSETVALPPREDLLADARRRYDLVFTMLRDPEQRSGLRLEEVLGLAQSMLCDWAFTNQEPVAFQVSHRAGPVVLCEGVFSPRYAVTLKQVPASKVSDGGRCLVCLRAYAGTGEAEEHKRFPLECGHNLCRSCFDCLSSAKIGPAINGNTAPALLDLSSDLMMGLQRLARCPFCRNELKPLPMY